MVIVAFSCGPMTNSSPLALVAHLGGECRVRATVCGALASLYGFDGRAISGVSTRRCLKRAAVRCRRPLTSALRLGRLAVYQETACVPQPVTRRCLASRCTCAGSGSAVVQQFCRRSAADTYGPAFGSGSAQCGDGARGVFARFTLRRVCSGSGVCDAQELPKSNAANLTSAR